MGDNDRDKYRGDVWYETWRSGDNPDMVDDDRVDDCFYDEDCAAAEVQRQRRNSEGGEG